MDEARARELLAAERVEVTALLADLTRDGDQARSSQGGTGDFADPAQPLAAGAVDDAITSSLTDRIAALDRAEKRLAAGSYGRSIRSGDVIPEERLEADPAAELTVEEAAARP